MLNVPLFGYLTKFFLIKMIKKVVSSTIYIDFILTGIHYTVPDQQLAADIFSKGSEQAAGAVSSNFCPASFMFTFLTYLTFHTPSKVPANCRCGITGATERNCTI